MLALPLLRGEQVNLAAALAPFLQKQYGDSVLEAITSDTNAYNQFRNHMISATEATDQNIQILHRFHFHMSVIVPRLSGFQDELKLKFVWYDGFKPSQKISSNSFAVDWACGLWNLGAMFSQLGAKADRSTEEGIRTANKYFTQAAGVFELIRKTVMPQVKTTVVSGLTDDGLQMAIQLMLAQAQFCFYEKAVRDKKAGTMKPGVVAKLAVQTGAFYGTVKSMCQMAALVSVLDNSWASTADFQCKSFRAAGEYWQSQASKELALSRGSGYGEEIARLLLAERYLREAIESAVKSKLNSTLSSAAETLLSSVVQTRTKAEQENRTVYMETIPAESSLTDIGGVVMVRSTPLGEYSGSEKLLFREIYPNSVRQVRAGHRDAIDNVLREATEKSSAATNECRSVIGSLGLPNSLDAYKSGGKLPDAVWLKIERLQAMGGIQELGAKFDEIQAAAGRASQSLLSIDQSLLREENADDAFREKHAQWNSPASKMLNEDIRVNAQRMRGAIESARASDKVVAETLKSEPFVQSCKLLNLRREEIEKLMPKPLIEFDEPSVPSAAVNTRALEELLSQMSDLIESREGLVAAIQAIANEDVTEELLACLNLSSGEAGFNAVCARHLSRAQEKLSLLLNNINSQLALLDKIKSANLQFTTALQSDSIVVEREKVIKDIDQNVGKYFTLHAQLAAGSTFYSGLQSRLSTLQQSSDDLGYSQQLRRQEYEAEYARELERQQRAAAASANARVAELATPSYGSTPSGYPQFGSSPYSYGDVSYGQLVNGPPAMAATMPSANPSYGAVAYPNYPNTTAPPVTGYSGPSTAPQYNLQPGQQANVLGNAGNVPAAYHQQQQPQPWQAPPQPQLQPPQPQAQYYQQYQFPPNAQPYGSAPAQYPSTPIAPMAAPAASMPSAADLGAKAYRLSEMGFSYDSCMAALQANNGDENNALNALLSGPVDPAPQPASAVPAVGAAAPPKPPKSSMFSRMLGK